MGAGDASLVAIAEQRSIRRILTLDADFASTALVAGDRSRCCLADY
jgi:predicted nucleic acid-binding protein